MSNDNKTGADSEKQPKPEADNDWFVQSPVPVPEACPSSRINLAVPIFEKRVVKWFYTLIGVSVVVIVALIVFLVSALLDDGNRGKTSELSSHPITAKSQSATKSVPRAGPLAPTRANEAQNGVSADMRFVGQSGEPVGIFVNDLPEGDMKVFFMKQSKSSDTVEIKRYSCVPSD